MKLESVAYRKMKDSGLLMVGSDSKFKPAEMNEKQKTALAILLLAETSKRRDPWGYAKVEGVGEIHYTGVQCEWVVQFAEE